MAELTREIVIKPYRPFLTKSPGISILYRVGFKRLEDQRVKGFSDYWAVFPIGGQGR